MNEYTPPFTITDNIINLIGKIERFIGSISSLNGELNPILRRDNRIRTIYSSLAIEQNSLSLNAVTKIINGKKVLGLPNEIKEVENAYQTYQQLAFLDPYSVDDLLAAHKQMMSGLVPEAGVFRSGGVGVFKGNKVVHVAPPAKRVSTLIGNLFSWLKSTSTHPLIKSCVFHYEFEFIHPFSDGNGRIGRLWQTLILSKWQEVFLWLPVETIIKDRQTDYYTCLNQADNQADSTVFIEFMLSAILQSLKETDSAIEISPQVEKLLNAIIADKTYSIHELMENLNLKNRASFYKNYLQPAIQKNLIEMTLPSKPTSKNQRYRRKL